MQSLPPALQPLAAYRQFIAYKLVPSATRPGKTDKIPVHPTLGHKVDLTDPSQYVAFDQVTAGDGKGFVFTEADPFFFLDIDNCLQPDGQWAPIVHELCGKFAGAAVEISQSGRGLHIFGTGTAPGPRKCKAPGFDLYTEGRFVALTGTHAQGNAATRHDPALAALVAQYLALEPGESADSGWWSTEPVEGWTGYTDDDELIQVALRSVSAASAFGGRASFADLWYADEEKLAACYPPDQGGESYDASAVDAALAQHLAFHTGNNAERMLTLMERSALRRDKWDRPDYLPRTIRKACAQQRDVFKRRESAVPVQVVRPAEENYARPVPSRVTGNTFLNAEEQMALFDGCCYVADQHRIMAGDGTMLSKGQFDARFGGYTFAMDAEGKRMVRSAWECFTESQLLRFPKADTSSFRPDRPIGELVFEGGYHRVNTYYPVEVPRMKGDATPFWRHLELVLPNERDRRILMCYMAACVQYKGIKFQWAPLIIGPPGNGKTLFTRCVANAIGKRYVHWPKASKLAKQFNGWMVGKLFYGVEDIYTADAKVDVIEELKPMITGGDGLEVELKGVDQTSADICGNFIFNSNHADGIRKARNDRRYAVMFTAQDLHTWDVEKDPVMRGQYFPKLYDWLREEGGYAIVTDLLMEYPIDPEFNPAKHCHRAPLTSTTDRAIKAGLGRAQQEIVDQIEQDAPGFAGGWVSSTAIERLMDARRINLPKVRYKDVLLELGYQLHPLLPDGRANRVIATPDGNKPRLYVRTDHPSLDYADPYEVVSAYEKAQGPMLGS